MIAIFSAAFFFGIIAAVVSGIVWIVQRLRHRQTRARVVCIAAALVTVIGIVGISVMYEPTETVEGENTEPAQSGTQPPTETPAATPTPVITPEPEATPQGTTEPPETSSVPEETGPATTSEPPEEIDPIEQAKQDIEAAARAIVAEHYTQTDVSRVTVNEDYGTEADDDFVLLVYLTWNVKNSAKMTKEVLAMYSEDFAARVGSDLENVQEVALFWTVPYFSETDIAIKYSYERRGAGMYQTDKMIMIE